jgi:type II secretory pathway predicted ATPase ExeA
MFLSFYKLREQPFGVTPDHRFLYESETHKATLASLMYGIESDLGFTALFAEPGMGKTTLLFRILEGLRSSALTAFIFQTQCSSKDLLKYLLQELEVETVDNDPVVLHQQIQQVLVKAARTGRRVILIVDEAQNLDVSVLETVRLLSNFETPRAKLLHTILSGQPQLATRLARPEMVQLRQRIAMTSRLDPLTPGEVALYIEHRLRVAGLAGDSPFNHSALEAIASWSGGIPRKINRVCFNSLTIGCSLDKTAIDKGIVEKAISDFDALARPAGQTARTWTSGLSEDGSTYRIFLPPRRNPGGGNPSTPQGPNSGNTPKVAIKQAGDPAPSAGCAPPDIKYGANSETSARRIGPQLPDLRVAHTLPRRRRSFPARVGVRVRLSVPGTWKSLVRWTSWLTNRLNESGRVLRS